MNLLSNYDWGLHKSLGFDLTFVENLKRNLKAR